LRLALAFAEAAIDDAFANKENSIVFSFQHVSNPIDS
jgi:hypothetical protein